MARKPAHLVAAAKRPVSRQVIWQHIRANRDGFTQRTLMDPTDIHQDTIRSYLRGLEAAGYIERLPDLTDKKAMQWKLVKDVGVEAPRVTKDGQPVTQGFAREQMWRTMKRLQDFTFRDLALASSTEAVPVNEEDAKDYCRNLALAGYLLVIAKRRSIGKGANPSIYRFNRAQDTGPRPPMIQRMQTVFDPNLGKIVWHPEVDE